VRGGDRGSKERGGGGGWLARRMMMIRRSGRRWLAALFSLLLASVVSEAHARCSLRTCMCLHFSPARPSPVRAYFFMWQPAAERTQDSGSTRKTRLREFKLTDEACFDSFFI
jgi:hypothetical protein